MTLTNKKCVPCERDTESLKIQRVQELLKELSYWKLSADIRSIHKTYKFKNWQEAHSFVNKISEIAEAEGHHPQIDLDWGRVGVALTTHAIKGLSENDFILAAKIDAIQ